MPILTSVPVTIFDQDAFHKVDTKARGLAFDIHNRMGRFLDEELYKIELCNRLRRAGFQAETEMQITLVLDEFRQDYFVDLFVENGVAIETKAIKKLSAAHKAQLLNYLYLCNLHHGTLLNFRGERVEHEFVSTTISQGDRFCYEFNITSWKGLSPQCEKMKYALERALSEWGRGLSASIYRNFIAHVLGGKGAVVRTIPILSENKEIGLQEMYLLTNEIAYSITTSIHRPDVAREHQQRFLNHTPLNAIQWCNLNRENIHLETIYKQNM